MQTAGKSEVSAGTSEKPIKPHEAIVSDRRGQKYTKMWAIHENALMRSAIDHDTGSIFPMNSGLSHGPRGSSSGLSSIPLYRRQLWEGLLWERIGLC